MLNPEADNADAGEHFAAVVIAKLSYGDARRLHDCVLAYLDPDNVDAFTRAFLAEMAKGVEVPL